jgi:predicted O-methyltransferase YrrM
VIVNIGAGAGTSGLAIVEAGADPRFVWTIDLSPSGPTGGLENERNAFRPTGLQIPNQVLGDSKAVGSSWEHGPIDLIFIDGDHSTEGLEGDIMAWLPWVKSGGWMLFHDYSSNNWPAVYEVVNRTMSFAPVAFSIETLHARRMP